MVIDWMRVALYSGAILVGLSIKREWVWFILGMLGFCLVLWATQERANGADLRPTHTEDQVDMIQITRYYGDSGLLNNYSYIAFKDLDPDGCYYHIASRMLRPNVVVTREDRGYLLSFLDEGWSRTNMRRVRCRYFKRVYKHTKEGVWGECQEHTDWEHRRVGLAHER